jgi:tetratricopeptide (TPR) repeat protein
MTINEYRVYLPSAGFFAALTTAVFLFLERFGRKRIAVALFCIVSLALAYSAYERNALWKSKIRLWEDVVKKSPHLEKGHINLALNYLNSGLAKKAVEQYQIALSINPYSSEQVYNNLGVAYGLLGLDEEAIRNFKIALKLKPDFADAHNNIGSAYDNNGLTDEAIYHFTAALKIRPDYANAHFNLALAYMKKGDTKAAIEEFEAVLRITPDDEQALYYLGNLKK